MGSNTVAGQAPVGISGDVLSKYWIDDWRPEEAAFWKDGGERVAKRNLAFSIFAEHIGFSVWTLWAVFVLFMGKPYGFDPSQKFLLTAVPAAAGSMLRLPYTFAVARFGGRNWTIFSVLMLLVPCTFAGLVLKPGVSFSTALIAALLAGIGGGNFASSMANINAYYPQRLKGWALGLNAGGGNIGVPAAQLVGLAVLALAGKDHPRFGRGDHRPGRRACSQRIVGHNRRRDSLTPGCPCPRRRCIRSELGATSSSGGVLPGCVALKLLRRGVEQFGQLRRPPCQSVTDDLAEGEHRRIGDCVDHAVAVLPSVDDPRVVEHAEVLGDVLLRAREHRDEFADALLPTPQVVE